MILSTLSINSCSFVLDFPLTFIIHHLPLSLGHDSDTMLDKHTPHNGMILSTLNISYNVYVLGSKTVFFIINL